MSTYQRISSAQKIPSGTYKSATIDQTATQNTWYPVLDTRRVRIFNLRFAMQTANETLELRATINGTIINMAAINAVAGSEYWAYLAGEGTATLGRGVDAYQFGGYFSGYIDFQTFKVEIRKTTATGANKLDCWIGYQNW